MQCESVGVRKNAKEWKDILSHYYLKVGQQVTCQVNIRRRKYGLGIKRSKESLT